MHSTRSGRTKGKGWGVFKEAAVPSLTFRLLHAHTQTR